MDGTAEEGSDYRGVHDNFVFEPFQTEVEIDLEIMDDDEWEPDEEFFLKISLLPNSEDSGVIKIGKRHIMTIKILNDDLPGTFQFEKRAYFVKESCGKAEIVVFRECGADGDVKVSTENNNSPPTVHVNIYFCLTEKRWQLRGLVRLPVDSLACQSGILRLKGFQFRSLRILITLDIAFIRKSQCMKGHNKTVKVKT